MLTPAYLAGIIDGEGSIYSRNRNPHISVANTSRPLIDALAELGGHSHERDRKRSIGNKLRIISGEKAAILLRACLPFLIIKREKAEDALSVWSEVSRNSHVHFAEIARAEMARIGWTT